MRILPVNNNLHFKNTLVKRLGGDGRDDFDRMFDNFDRQFEKGRIKRQKKIERTQKIDDTKEVIEEKIADGVEKTAKVAPILGLAGMLISGTVFPPGTISSHSSDSRKTPLEDSYDIKPQNLPKQDNAQREEIVDRNKPVDLPKEDDVSRDTALSEITYAVFSGDVPLDDAVLDESATTGSTMEEELSVPAAYDASSVLNVDETEPPKVQLDIQPEPKTSAPETVSEQAPEPATEPVAETAPEPTLEPILEAQAETEPSNAPLNALPDAPNEPFTISLSDSQEYALTKFLEVWNESSWRYQNVSEETGVPAILIAALHFRESSGNFNARMSDGGSLGEYSTWEESAIDVLSRKYYSSANIVYGDFNTYYAFAERYNGYGYRDKHNMKSPYVWAGTSNYACGKYVKDGKFDPDAVDRQLGVAVMLDALKDYDCA